VKIQFAAYFLEFRYPFVLSIGSRTHTPVVYIKLEDKGLQGYGEATLPPYLPDTQESVISFLKNLDLQQFSLPFEIEKVHAYLDKFPGNYPAKAALDIAFHDLLGKYQNLSVTELLEIENRDYPYCTYTLGIGDKDSISQKVNDAKDFNYFKLKLGGNNDEEIIDFFKTLTDKPFCIDANQGWKNKEEALDMIYWLLEKEATLIEQPMPKHNYEDFHWLSLSNLL